MSNPIVALMLGFLGGIIGAWVYEEALRDSNRFWGEHLIIDTMGNLLTNTGEL